jgi:hypothetical protein
MGPETEMPELPKFAIERLKVSAALGMHPDADVLTAFAERSLPASERAVVLEHLARCGDCRDVLALAAPATETVEFERASFGLRSRWGWPVLRGLAVAAGVVAVAAVGIHQYRQRTPANAIVARGVERDQVAASPVPNVAGTAAPGAETVPPSAEPRHEAASRQVEGGAEKLSVNKPLSSTADAFGWRAKSTGVAGGAGGGIGAGAGLTPGTKMAMAERPRDLDFAAPQAPSANTTKQIPAPSPADREAPSAVSGAVEMQSEVVTAEARAPTQSLSAQSADVASVESADNVRRAKPAPVAAGAAVGGTAVVARNQIDLRPNEEVAVPHWTISSTGSLQRSVDGGKTWQDVNVNTITGFYASARPMAVVSSDRESKEVTKKLTKEKTAKSETTPLFHAVAAFGNEVWAGASGGLLYHSADAGALWTSMIPSAQGVTLSGDIVRIEFSDALHGKITTSTSENWMTADGGQSWQKQ